MSLEDIIKQQIKLNGPMDVGTFMGLALGHPEFGYYMTRDPFGEKGDFTTAPEVSQMFGELIGIWVADQWMKLGSPSRFYLVECGPGRGTLMADLLRGTRNIPGFHDAVQIHMIEMSPVLQAKQKSVLADYDVVWHARFDEVPGDAPLVVVANEFLDALPIRQLQKDKGQWAERVVGVEGDKLAWGLKPVTDVLNVEAEEGTVFEFAPARREFVEGVYARLLGQGGKALFIDYGHVRTAPGDTLQAVKGHEFVDVLAEPGEADLTSHVDFEILAHGRSHELMTQAEFLNGLGIGIRAEMLKKRATEEQKAVIDQALHRLTHPDEMGQLFKVLVI